MLGSELAQVFHDSDLYLWDREDIDIADKQDVSEKIFWLNPDIIINAAAYTAVDEAEENRDLANSVNGYGISNLAYSALETRAVFVHYSTDYVFSGKRKSGYSEDHKPRNPVNAYGASKLLGEQKLLEIMPLRKFVISSPLQGRPSEARFDKAISENSTSLQKLNNIGFNSAHGNPRLPRCPLSARAREQAPRNDKKLIAVGRIENNKDARFYLIRLSWLFGKGGKNFVDTILQLARERGNIKVIDDQFGKPTYAPDLAKRTRNLIENKKPFGIYHLPNQGVCSWYELAKEALECSGIRTEIAPCTSREFPRPAKRPRYSVLLNTKMEKGRHWREALREYLK